MTVSYSELVTQIRAYTEVDSSVLSDTIVNDFIKFAENRLFRDVDIDVFKSHQTANLTASNPFITLPGGSAPDPTSLGTVRYMQIFAPTGTPTREYLETLILMYLNHIKQQISRQVTLSYLYRVVVHLRLHLLVPLDTCKYLHQLARQRESI